MNRLPKLEDVVRRHFPRKSTHDGSYHLDTCEHGIWRNGQRPQLCTKNCLADRAFFDAMQDAATRAPEARQIGLLEEVS